jgi:hypothetical protein
MNKYIKMLEAKMTPNQTKKREEIVKSMKSNQADMKKQYGDRWEDVMYATATKQAMSEATNSMQAGISDELAAKKIANKIAGTPDLNISKIKQYVTKYLTMVGKSSTDVTHLTALVATELENKGMMEAKKVETNTRKKVDEAPNWLKSGAMGAAMATSAMGGAAQAQDSNTISQQSQSSMTQPTFMNPAMLASFEQANAKWMASKPWTGDIDDLNEIIDFFNRASKIPFASKNVIPKAIPTIMNFFKEHPGRNKNNTNEAARPDYPDVDGDGNEDESMEKAFADKNKNKEKVTEGVLDSTDDDGWMAKSQLYQLAKYAAELHKMINDSDDLEPWVQAKITTATEDISSVKHYMEYLVTNGAEIEVEPENQMPMVSPSKTNISIDDVLRPVTEAKKKSLKNPKDNPCWDGYEPIGTKKIKGKTVPNCVPKK